MLFTWRQYDSQAILNFGAVGAASLPLWSREIFEPIADRIATSLEPIRKDNGYGRWQ